MRVTNVVEKDIVAVPIAPIVVLTNTNTLILPDITNNGEYVGRYIQNVGANDLYYAIGHDCDSTNFNGILSKPATTNAAGFGSGQQLDYSNVGQRINVYSTGGTTVAVTLLKRNDLSNVNTGILTPGEISGG